jgi:hypothetical protein
MGLTMALGRVTGEGRIDEAVRHDIKQEVIKAVLDSGGKDNSKRMMIINSIGANSAVAQL